MIFLINSTTDKVNLSGRRKVDRRVSGTKREAEKPDQRSVDMVTRMDALIVVALARLEKNTHSRRPTLVAWITIVDSS